MRVLYTLIFCFWLYSPYAQNSNFVHYTSGRKINDLALDGQYVWAASAGGLVKHDLISGQSEFFNRANSGMPINEVYSIAIGPDGAIWLGTQIGLVRWENGEFTTLNPTSFQLIVRKVRVDASGVVWMNAFGQNHELISFDGQAWKSYDDDALFNDLLSFEAVPTATGVWVNGADNNFYHFDGVTSDIFPFPNPPGSAHVSDWLVDDNSRVWFVSNDKVGVPVGNSWNIEYLNMSADAVAMAAGSLWVIDLYKGILKRKPSGLWEQVWDGPLSIESTQFVANENNILVVGTSDKGMFKVTNGVQSPIASSVSNIPDHSVVDLEITGTQDVWATFEENYNMGWPTNGESLSHFHEGNWETVNTPASSSPFFRSKSMARDALGRLWVSHVWELYRFDAGLWDEIPFPAEFPFNQVYGVGANPESDVVWISGHNKVARYNGSSFQVFDVLEAGTSIYNLVVDQQGNLWTPYAGADGEGFIGRFDGENWTVFSKSDMQLSDFTFFPRDIKVSPNGDIWVVCPKEICHYDGSNWHKFPLESWGIGEFSTLAFDGTDTVWIGCYQVNCFSVNPNLNLIKIENNEVSFYPYNSTPLPYPNITALAVDGLHNLWIGTEHGGIAVFNEKGVTLGFADWVSPKPYEQMLSKAVPNPASDLAVIEYELAEKSDLWLELSSCDGKLCQSEKLVGQTSGKHNWPIHLGQYPKGVYCYRIVGEKSLAFGTVVRN